MRSTALTCIIVIITDTIRSKRKDRDNNLKMLNGLSLELLRNRAVAVVRILRLAAVIPTI
jgi:hypothetical protein